MRNRCRRDGVAGPVGGVVQSAEAETNPSPEINQPTPPWRRRGSNDEQVKRILDLGRARRISRARAREPRAGRR
jgi:hypothetical protein